VFAHEDIFEYQALGRFPAFIKQSGYHVCPAVLSIAYSVASRIQEKFKKKIRVDQDVAVWLESDFKLKELPADYHWHTTPKDFQVIALRYLYTLGSGGLALDPGMGKSKVALEYIYLMKFKRSVVVCPVPLLFVWEDEIKIHRPELSFHVVSSTDWGVEVAAGMLTKDVIIVNYTKVALMKYRFKETPIDFLYLDECLIKDITTDRTKTMLEIGAAIPYKSWGSGTIINNTPLDLYCPTRFVQPSLVGTNYTHFKDTYTVQVPMKDERGQPTKRMSIVAFKGQKEMKSILESASIVMTKDVWLKLPSKTFHDIQVQMSPVQKTAYYELQRNLYTNIDGFEVQVDNPLVRAAKLYQISNGFVYTYPEDEEEVTASLLSLDYKPKKKNLKDRTTYYFKDQPKLDALERILTERISGRKAMIWFNMGAERQLITDRLDKLGQTYLTIEGGDKKIGEKVRQFNRDPNIRFLVCQSKSVNYGITILGSKKKDLEEAGIEIMPGIDPSVHIQIFYALSYSLEVYLQMQDRIHRLGQEHPCEYFRLYSNSPIEKRILQVLDDKQYIKTSMMVDVAETLLGEIVD
jgi:SNF2 family DNA or RNA helicase